MPEQDPIPPRRSARRHALGDGARRVLGNGSPPEDARRVRGDDFLPDEDDLPPWANMPSVRPARPGQHGARRPHSGPAQHDQGDPGGWVPQGKNAPPRHAGPVRQPGPGPTQQPGRAHDPGRMQESAGYPQSEEGYPQSEAGYSNPEYVDQPGADQFDAENQFGDADDPGPDQEQGGHARSRGARARRALLRRRRRSVIVLGGAVVAIAAVLVTLLVSRSSGASAVIPNDFITTFQPGELQQVPDACQVIPAATIQQYLPGKVKQAAPLPIDGKLGSACNWTLDHQPTYRLLELNMLAYAPNGLASGNGSATSAATDAYTQALQNLQVPPKGSVGSKATVTTLSGLGDQAFSAMQVFHVGGAVSDQAVVAIRFHNVVVTVEFSGLEHSNKGHYGPVSQSELSAAAMAFAQAAYASLH